MSTRLDRKAWVAFPDEWRQGFLRMAFTDRRRQRKGFAAGYRQALSDVRDLLRRNGCGPQTELVDREIKKMEE